ncbi:MAG: heterodisulfide reductase-related iron-sulfur binding cluster [Candidatus Adiutricales bacterium]
MTQAEMIDLSYFPGCSLATSARESNQSLIEAMQILGYNLIELEDWNCCGSSSAHALDHDLALGLTARNLSLAQADRPLLIACPNCLHRMRNARLRLSKDEQTRRAYERRWGRPINPNLEISHVFEIMDRIDRNFIRDKLTRKLKGLKFVAYYGCMLARPPALRREKNYYGLLEKIVTDLGGEAISWAHGSHCCGTFLSAAKPEISTVLVNEIMGEAQASGAECVITACAMCQFNLELRSTLDLPIPILHFSEILALALGVENSQAWFARHLVDPRPLIQSYGLTG